MRLSERCSRTTIARFCRTGLRRWVSPHSGSATHAFPFATLSLISETHQTIIFFYRRRNKIARIAKPYRASDFDLQPQVFPAQARKKKSFCNSQTHISLPAKHTKYNIHKPHSMYPTQQIKSYIKNVSDSVSYVSKIEHSILIT